MSKENVVTTLMSPARFNEKEVIYKKFVSEFLASVRSKKVMSITDATKFLSNIILFGSDEVVKAYWVLIEKIRKGGGLVYVLRVITEMRKDLCGGSEITPLEIGQLLIKDLSEHPEITEQLKSFSASIENKGGGE